MQEWPSELLGLDGEVDDWTCQLAAGTCIYYLPKMT
jgi:hypothetical protein